MRSGLARVDFSSELLSTLALPVARPETKAAPTPDRAEAQSAGRHARRPTL